jgi:hypothetical protein
MIALPHWLTVIFFVDAPMTWNQRSYDSSRDDLAIVLNRFVAFIKKILIFKYFSMFTMSGLLKRSDKF